MNVLQASSKRRIFFSSYRHHINAISFASCYKLLHSEPRMSTPFFSSSPLFLFNIVLNLSLLKLITMAVFIKAKRVSGPLDHRVRARLLDSTSSSGSEHDANAEPSCLCGLLHAFIDLDEPNPSQTAASSCNCGAIKSDDDDDDDRSDISTNAVAMLKSLLDSSSKLDFQSEIAEAAEAFGCKRAVMANLRARGYNAGLCKAKWEGSGGLIAGDYEYIDIVVSDEKRADVRYVVDLDFAAQFEVARATAGYEELVAMLPRVMAAREEEMKQMVRVMAGAAKTSLKSEGLSVPPWRKRRYMLAKWSGPYRRTVNSLPSSSAGAAAAVVGKGDQVKCRAVGFDDVIPRWGFAVAPGTRT